jgi:hypothetical protein
MKPSEPNWTQLQADSWNLAIRHILNIAQHSQSVLTMAAEDNKILEQEITAVLITEAEMAVLEIIITVQTMADLQGIEMVTTAMVA